MTGHQHHIHRHRVWALRQLLAIAAGDDLAIDQVDIEMHAADTCPGCLLMATQAIGLGWLRMLTSPADVGVYDVGATTTHIAAELAAVLDHIEHEQEH